MLRRLALFFFRDGFGAFISLRTAPAYPIPLRNPSEHFYAGLWV